MSDTVPAAQDAPPDPGELFGFNPFDPGFRKDPYSAYSQILQGPAVRKTPFGLWILSRHAEATAALHDARMSSDQRKSPMFAQAVEAGAVPERETEPPFLFLDPPDHTRLRGLVTKAFTPRTVENLRPRVQELVDEVIDAALERGSMEVIEDLAYPLPVTVICEMLGVPTQDHETFREWSKEGARSLDPEMVLPPEVLERRQRAFESFRAYFEDLIAQRRRQPRDDLLSELIAAEESGDKLTTEELITTCVLLLVAGHETTVNLIGNGILQLLRHPDELARLRRDPSLAKTATEEVLRFDPPVQFTTRLALEDVPIGDTVMPAGEQSLVLIGAVNRDDRVFEGPDRFDISRKPNPHVAFSLGPHFCLGAPLARIEGQIALATVASRLPGLQLATDDPEYKENIVLRGLAQLPVTF